MELGSKRRGIEEREKFRPRYLPFALLFSHSPRPDTLLAIVFSRRIGRRKAPSLTIVPEDDQGSMTPSPSLSLSLLLAKFENRWILVSRVFQSSSLPIWRSKSLLESNDILSRASSGPCRSLSTRTVRRFSGRAVESCIYIRLYSNFDADRCNVFLFWR